MIKVAISYIHYPVSMGGYMHRAIKRMPEFDVRSVGPYTGNWIPWKGGMMLPEKYRNKPDYITSGSDNAMSVDTKTPATVTWAEAMMRADGFMPDVWLHIDSGWRLLGRATTGAPNIYVGTDPHVVNYNTSRQFADIFYGMQTPYIQYGDRYLPYAYDPEAHAPLERGSGTDYDATCVGLTYETRLRWANLLRGKGYKVYLDTGPSFDEARGIYSLSKVGFNWSSRKDLCARVFELAAMGVPMVVNDVPDIHHFLNSSEVAVFSDMDGAVSETVDLIENPEKAANMAELAQESIKPHTWDSRMAEVLNGF